MATASKLTENYLTCIICSEVYTDPATLQCDHTFCRPCLLKYIKTQPEAIQAKSIPCPCCRQMTRVPSPDRPVEEWVNQVKLSHLMQGLLDDFGPGSKLCDACRNEGETTPATSWCEECEESLCDSCVRMHRRFSMTRSHQVSTLSGDSNKIKKRHFMCTQHKDEQIKLFCKDCRKPICHICSNVNHRQCVSVVTLESVTQEVTKALQQERDHLSMAVKKKTQLLSELNDRMTKIQTSSKSAEKEIRAVAQDVISKVKAKEDKLLSKVSELKDVQMAKLKCEKKSEEIALQMSQQKLEFTEQAVSSECRKDMFAIYESCEESTDDKKETLEGIFQSDFRWDRHFMGRIAFEHDEELLNKSIDEIELGRVCTKRCTIS